ncbi:MAG: hypothetical protein E6I45_09730 [Chloroflexi bacterium]|nr:MAG: hypothetical protein E6I45_09730 [Chloroflexota bacterium]
MATSSRPSAVPWTGISLLFVGAAFAAVACMGGPPRNANNPASPGAAAASVAPAAADDSEVARLTANLHEAIRNHDMRRYYQFRKELSAQIGAGAIKAVDDAYRHVLANLAAAQRAHDAKARAEFSSQLRTLCSPTTLTSAIELCEADLAALAG